MPPSTPSILGIAEMTELASCGHIDVDRDDQPPTAPDRDMGGVGGDLQLQLRYPSAWFAPVALSAFAQTIGKCTIDWLDELGLLKDATTRDHVLAMEPHHYAGYSHSMASYDHALLYSKYITLWLLWDDQVVERANHIQDAMPPLHALGGGTCDWSDPFCVGFRQIGDGYVLHGATSEWRWRFSNVMLEWARHAVAEESMRREAMQSAPHMAFTDALRQRSFTVGIRPNSIPLERAAGFELPAFVYSSSTYARLMDAAARICCLVNDLVGIRKDIANRQISSNMVLHYQRCFGGSLGKACSVILDIHDQAVQEFDQLAAALLSECAPPFIERLTVFLSHLRYMDTGFAFWHRDCVRYHPTRGEDASVDTRLEILRA